MQNSLHFIVSTHLPSLCFILHSRLFIRCITVAHALCCEILWSNLRVRLSKLKTLNKVVVTFVLNFLRERSLGRAFAFQTHIFSTILSKCASTSYLPPLYIFHCVLTEISPLFSLHWMHALLSAFRNLKLFIFLSQVFHCKSASSSAGHQKQLHIKNLISRIEWFFRGIRRSPHHFEFWSIVVFKQNAAFSPFENKNLYLICVLRCVPLSPIILFISHHLYSLHKLTNKTNKLTIFFLLILRSNFLSDSNVLAIT